MGIQRFWDLITILIMSLVSAIIAFLSVQSLLRATLLFVIGSICSVLFVIGLYYGGKTFSERVSGKATKKILSKLLSVVNMILVAIKNKGEKKVQLKIAVLSICYWSFMLLHSYGIFYSLHPIKLTNFVILVSRLFFD